MSSEQKCNSVGDGGYSCKFVDESQPDGLFKCRICTLVLRDPHITECCGENACHFCIVKAADNGGPCPIPGCRSKSVKINLNRDLRSIILESAVYCHSKEAGCEWVGKLDELSKHLKEECLFVEEKCQHHCGIQMQRQAVEDHKKICQRLPIECHQCGEMYERCRHTDHVKVCPFTKTECPFHIVGCKSKVANKDMQQHFNDSLSEHYTMVVEQSQNVRTQLREANLMTSGQKERIALGSAEIDLLSTEIAEAKEEVCRLQHTLKEVKRKYIELRKNHDQLKGQIQTHTQHRAATSCALEKHHTTLMFESKVRCYGPALPSIHPADIVSRPLDSLPTTREYTPRVSFTIKNFETERKNDAVLCSPTFYSHSGGYKMCLVVYCNGCCEAKGNYVTIFISVLKGKYDNYLEWPLNCTVAIEISGVHSLPGIDGIHRLYTIKAQNRVHGDGCPNLQHVSGNTKTVSLSLLGPYLNQGSLKIKVSSVTK